MAKNCTAWFPVDGPDAVSCRAGAAVRRGVGDGAQGAAAGEAEASAEDGVRTEVEAEAAVAVEASGMSSVCAERVRRASK